LRYMRTPIYTIYYETVPAPMTMMNTEKPELHSFFVPKTGVSAHSRDVKRSLGRNSAGEGFHELR